MTAQRRELLKVKIQALFDYNDGTYGYCRIHAELVRAGEQVGEELVRTLMRELELWPCQPRPYKTTTIRGDSASAADDLLRPDFTADRPGCTWVSDITDIHTWEGWLYLASAIDCFNSEVVGYAMAGHMRTDLVTAAVQMAARNHIVEPGCILHSDRGSQPGLNWSMQHRAVGVRLAGRRVLRRVSST